jgi:uncharacterized protein YbjT (DUF2867 family)
MKILVTGATGNIGRRIVDHLLAAGADDVRALTTDPVRAALPNEVEVVEGYVRQPETLPAALAGVERMYLAPSPETVDDVVDLAAMAGVQHVVDLSGPEESWWYSVAEAVERSGVAWTHLWPGEFMENLSMWADQIRTTGQVREPYPDAANDPIAMDDIAAVAATVLTEDGHTGQAYPLRGPEILSRREMAHQLGRAIGRDVEFVEVSREEGIEILTRTMGEYAEWYMDGLAELFGAPGQPDPPADEPARRAVQEITGRPATTLSEWAVQHAAEFR